MSKETIHEIRQGMKFRPVLHALTSNPGVEMMSYAKGKENLISMAQGEGSAPTPDFICRAAYNAMQDGKTFYGQTLGQDPLREAISEYYKDIYELYIPASRTFVTASGSTAMHLSLASLLDKGDEVVAITPIWKNLLGAIELTQATTRQVSLDYSDDQGWTLDIEKLFAACNERTKVMLIVSPSNPTGWTATQDEMRTILEFARERGIWILSDEVYSRLVYESPHKHLRADSFLDVAKPDDQLLVVNSFSKSWAMTGWRIGWIVGPAAAEEKIRDVALYNNLCPPTFSQYGAIAALKEGEPFIKNQIDLWRGNRDLTVRRFDEMGKIKMAHPSATFYGFFKVEGQRDCKTMTKRFIDECGVLMSPGCAFGKEAVGYIRMCFAISERRLTEALDRMETVIKKL
ncbi:MAG: pyridoxal phosphate-dependent aminotransferase [Micavibrio sp.]|nr:pyridoxal phosphate-dependent aminotransferase [Micavibrio sp.]